MNENIKKFRNAVGGYNKEDVNAYIKEMDLAQQERQESYAKELTECTAQRDALTVEKEALLAEQAVNTAEKEAMQIQMELQTEQLRTVEENNRSLQEKVDTLLNQVTVQEKSHADAMQSLQTEKAQVEEQVAQLTEALQQAKEQLVSQKAESDQKIAEQEAALAREKTKAAEEIERFKAAFNENEDSVGYKIRMYDRISGQIGDILLGANRDADDILTEAKEEAERLRTETADALEKERSAMQIELDRLKAETEAEAVCMRKKISETAETLLADFSGEMHLNIENCLKELATCMTEVESDTETLLQTTQRRYQEMNERIQYYQSCLQEHIDTRLTEMDSEYGIAENRGTN